MKHALLALTALLLSGWALSPFARAQSQELSVELRVSPRAEKGRISPYIFGAGIDAKPNPFRAPRYREHRAATQRSETSQPKI